MDTLSFLTAAIDGDIGRWRTQRLDRVRQILDTPSTDLATREPSCAPSRGSGALEFAVAHHRLEGAETAARAGDEETLAWYRRSRADSFATLRLPASQAIHLVPAVDPANMETSQLSDTPYFLLGPSVHAAGDEILDLSHLAIEAAAEQGFGPLLTLHAPVICLLRRRTLGETMASWTTTRLPGTVFTDHAGEPLVLARDAIHEAGHNWLNAALAARDVVLPDEPRYDSPWKQQPRPPFGFLHACWAFPLTMLFTASVLVQADGPVGTFLTNYLKQQKELLAETDAAHTDALGLVTDPELRAVLRAVYAEARSL